MTDQKTSAVFARYPLSTMAMRPITSDDERRELSGEFDEKISDAEYMEMLRRDAAQHGKVIA